MHLPDEIPDRLAPAAQAALLWVNNARATSYELTGLVDVDAGVDVANPFEIGLVLCDGDLCMREQVRVMPEGEAYRFDFVAEAAPDIPPLLDPPEGVRAEWLDRQLQNHEFVVLLYYRGLW